MRSVHGRILWNQVIADSRNLPTYSTVGLDLENGRVIGVFVRLFVCFCVVGLLFVRLLGFV